MKINQVSLTAWSMLAVIVMGQVTSIPWLFSPLFSGRNSGQATTTTVSFQDGVAPTASYAGTRDTMLSENNPNFNYGTDSRLQLDGDEPPESGKDVAILLSWDLSSLPKNSQVTSAQITLYFDESEENSYSDDRYSVFAMRRSWDENQATWFKSLANSFWETVGGSGTNDRGQAMGNFIPNQGRESVIVLSNRGVQIVQTWVTDPRKNFGLAISSPVNIDGVDFLSSETSTKSRRPKLTVSYQSAATLSKPPQNSISGSIFQDQGVSSAGVQATLRRSSSMFAGLPLFLTQGKTRFIEDWSVVNTYDVDLSLFNSSNRISVTLVNSNSSSQYSFSITPQQIKSLCCGYPFSFGMGQPSGTYTVTLTQGNVSASLSFEITEVNRPSMSINPSCTAPGKQLTLSISGFPVGTPLDLYRHDRNESTSSYWKYVNSIPAPKVNERGEAYYVLTTRRSDPKDSFLIVARDQGVEERFTLPCP